MDIDVPNLHDLVLQHQMLLNGKYATTNVGVQVPLL
jgi:hypothetical protein